MTILNYEKKFKPTKYGFSAKYGFLRKLKKTKEMKNY